MGPSPTAPPLTPTSPHVPYPPRHDPRPGPLVHSCCVITGPWKRTSVTPRDPSDPRLLTHCLHRKSSTCTVDSPDLVPDPSLPFGRPGPPVSPSDLPRSEERRRRSEVHRPRRHPVTYPVVLIPPVKTPRFWSVPPGPFDGLRGVTRPLALCYLTDPLPSTLLPPIPVNSYPCRFHPGTSPTRSDKCRVSDVPS